MDKSTGYRSKSMLTVPMQDHKGEILGVIQLINRKTDFALKIATPADVDRIVIPFSRDVEQLVLSLASQAAVSLENNKLYQDIETLFEGFVKASVTAIESRDPTTSGHSTRVAGYTVGLAEAVTRAGTGAYRNISFTPEHMKEIRYASLLHDFGKVGVREQVLVKADKLYPGQRELVRMRLAYIRKAKRYELLREKFAALLKDGDQGYRKIQEEKDRQENAFMEEIDRYLQTIEAANIPTVLAADPSRSVGRDPRQDVPGRRGHGPLPHRRRVREAQDTQGESRRRRTGTDQQPRLTHVQVPPDHSVDQGDAQHSRDCLGAP